MKSSRRTFRKRELATSGGADWWTLVAESEGGIPFDAAFTVARSSFPVLSRITRSTPRIRARESASADNCARNRAMRARMWTADPRFSRCARSSESALPGSSESGSAAWRRAGGRNVTEWKASATLAKFLIFVEPGGLPGVRFSSKPRESRRFDTSKQYGAPFRFRSDVISIFRDSRARSRGSPALVTAIFPYRLVQVRDSSRKTIDESRISAMCHASCISSLSLCIGQNCCLTRIIIYDDVTIDNQPRLFLNLWIYVRLYYVNTLFALLRAIFVPSESIRVIAINFDSAVIKYPLFADPCCRIQQDNENRQSYVIIVAYCSALRRWNMEGESSSTGALSLQISFDRVHEQGLPSQHWRGLWHRVSRRYKPGLDCPLRYVLAKPAKPLNSANHLLPLPLAARPLLL